MRLCLERFLESEVLGLAFIGSQETRLLPFSSPQAAPPRRLTGRTGAGGFAAPNTPRPWQIFLQ